MNLFEKISTIFQAKAESKQTPSTEPELIVSKLPTQIEDFSEAHIRFLRQLNGHPLNEPFTGILSFALDTSKFILVLQNLNLIRVASIAESLECLKNESLKKILKQFELKVSGNKKELCERILDNISLPCLENCNDFSYCYLLTQRGKQVIDNFYIQNDIEYHEYVSSVTNLIMESKLDEAYKIICKKNAESPLPHGLNFDWEKAYYQGLDSICKKVYMQFIHNALDIKNTALAIFLNASGESLYPLSQKLNLSPEQELNIHYINSLISNEIDMQNYLFYGIDSYTFLSSLYTKTCPICGSLDGKVFHVAERKAGINYPPMHKGCRCTTTAYDTNRDHTTRYAVNPKTGKTGQIPYMTYTEWKKRNNL